MEWGPTVKIGYFSQEGEELDDSMKVIDYIKEAGEYVTTNRRGDYGFRHAGAVPV